MEGIMIVMVIGGGGFFGCKTIILLLEYPEVTGVTSVDLAPPTEWVI